ncbi:MAG: hypothetical protein M3332_17420 [Actinomycetota bacterium]|nr:hypothetical protein [Actinomycetota bacterium]
MARLVVGAGPCPLVAVLSEIVANPDELGITADFAAAADAFVEVLASTVGDLHQIEGPGSLITALSTWAGMGVAARAGAPWRSTLWFCQAAVGRPTTSCHVTNREVISRR